MGMVACSPTPTAGDSEETNIDIEDVAEESDTLLGQEVTLRGAFLSEVDDASFKLKEDELFPDETVLVINVTGNKYSVPTGESTEMWLTGTVEQFERETLAKQYKLTLDPALYDEFQGQPVVLANYIALAPEPEEIAENPDVFYGQQVVVDGEVETVFAPDAFSLQNNQLFNDTGLLVVGAVPELASEGPVAVSGVLQPFSLTDLDGEYELLWEPDIQGILEEQFTGQPVVVVQEIYPFTE
ncbi:MAG: hypothetical protein ACFB2W_00425 [Leptolyngbyaceae cyanobacterium]